VQAAACWTWGAPSERNFAWESRRRGLIAIGAVGALRDREALPLLHEKLRNSVEQELVVKLADALGQIGSPESARPLFERLVNCATGGGRWNRETSTYRDLRTRMLNSSILSDELLVEWSTEGRTPAEQVVAKALRFALRHPSTRALDIFAESPDWTTMPVPFLFERALVLRDVTALNRLPTKEGTHARGSRQRGARTE
jgi:hypothetical protein